jgi:hypothetical protein
MAKNKSNGNGDEKTEGSESISKTEAVQKAVEQGWTKPTEGVMFIKTMVGIDLSPSHFSNIKSTLGTTQKKRPGRPPGIKSKPKAEAVPVAPQRPAVAPRSSGVIDIEAVQQVKELVDKLGPETMKGLIEALS